MSHQSQLKQFQMRYVCFSYINVKRIEGNERQKYKKCTAISITVHFSLSTVLISKHHDPALPRTDTFQLCYLCEGDMFVNSFLNLSFECIPLVCGLS